MNASCSGALIVIPARCPKIAARRSISAPLPCIGAFIRVGGPVSSPVRIRAVVDAPTESQVDKPVPGRRAHRAVRPGPERGEQPPVMVEQFARLEFRPLDAQRQGATAHAVQHAQAAALADLADIVMGLAGRPLRREPGHLGEPHVRIARGDRGEHVLVTAQRGGDHELLRAPIQVDEHAALGRLDQPAQPTARAEDELASLVRVAPGGAHERAEHRAVAPVGA